MKKFRFRYESILKIKQDYEDKIKNDLSKLFTELNTLKDQLELLLIQEQNFQAFTQKSLNDGGFGNQFHGIYEGQSYYRNRKNSLLTDIADMEDKIKNVQKLLLEAMKERKIMEKLKERAFQEFIDVFNEADAKLIEEVVNYNNSLKGGA